MAISTANTILKYGIAQVERAVVVGTITGSGNTTFTVTGAGITGSPVAVTVAVVSGDTPIIVAAKAAAAINLNAAISALYRASSDGVNVLLTRKLAAANDSSLNIAYTNAGATGLTPDATSDDLVAGVNYATLVDIINYPDLGSTPSKLDTTDLSQTTFKTSILGLQEIPDLTFECNYDLTDYLAIELLTGKYCFRLEFGAAGAEGIFTWDGAIKVFAMGGGVDEVRKMQITLSAETPITAI